MGAKNSRCKGKAKKSPSCMESLAPTPHQPSSSGITSTTSSPPSDPYLGASRPLHLPTMKLMEIPTEVECAVCLEVFDRPSTLPCKHTYCMGCIQNASECPVCRVALPTKWQFKEDPSMKKRLAKQRMTCHCGVIVSLAQANAHAATCKQSVLSICATSKAKLPVEDKAQAFAGPLPEPPSGFVRCPICVNTLSCFTPNALLLHFDSTHPTEHAPHPCPLCVAGNAALPKRRRHRRLPIQRNILLHLRTKHTKACKAPIHQGTGGQLGHVHPEQVILQRVLLESLAEARAQGAAASEEQEGGDNRQTTEADTQNRRASQVSSVFSEPALSLNGTTSSARDDGDLNDGVGTSRTIRGKKKSHFSCADPTRTPFIPIIESAVVVS